MINQTNLTFHILILSGERYVYKFVCDPEALFQVGQSYSVLSWFPRETEIKIYDILPDGDTSFFFWFSRETEIKDYDILLLDGGTSFLIKFSWET